MPHSAPKLTLSIQAHASGPVITEVDLSKGAMAEGFLTFTFCLAATLVIFTKGPIILLVKIWLSAMATVGLPGDSGHDSQGRP
ncbi:hypothetical protein SAY86_010979 [Trapa natans]|uniref:Uncharacterized protein n=1 Tax=Trapa natans TaxID=22666 RepID=A0AAN7LXK9_TRANT|nr:hypothetical protein SAY86_010979 [Trapa natans]